MYYSKLGDILTHIIADIVTKNVGISRKNALDLAVIQKVPKNTNVVSII